MNDPKEIAKGSGWSVYRLGRSFCVRVDRDGDGDPVEVWLPRQPSDVTRGSLLAALVAGTYGKVCSATATEAMNANW